MDPVEDLSTPITVHVAARPDALHILRVVAASAAALRELPFDAVDEVRIAVDEAGVLLLDSSPEADALQLEITTSDGSLLITIGTDVPAAEWPRPVDRESWSWTVIQGLTLDPRFVSGDDGRPAIRFRTRPPVKTP